MKSHFPLFVCAAGLLLQASLSAQKVKTFELRQTGGEPVVVEDVGLDYQEKDEARLSWNFGAAPWLASYASGGKLLTLPSGEQLRNEERWSKLVLFRFTLAEIPQGSKVRSARLKLHVESSKPRSVPHLYELRRVRKEGLDFGQANGAVAQGAVSARWSRTDEEGWGDGENVLMPRTGSDLETSPVAQAELEPGGEELIFEDISPFVVQDWLDYPERKEAIALYPRTISHAGGVQVLFTSSEGQRVEHRPMLEVEVEVARPE